MSLTRRTRRNGGGEIFGLSSVEVLTIEFPGGCLGMTRLLLALLFITAFSNPANSAEFLIMSVIRELPMKTGEPAQKDFYINAGKANGLRTGVFLDAIRKLPTTDNLNGKTVSNANVKIARLKVIFVDRSFSIARLVKLGDRDTTPVSGFDGVMMGDLVEVAEHQ